MLTAHMYFHACVQFLHLTILDCYVLSGHIDPYVFKSYAFFQRLYYHFFKYVRIPNTSRLVNFQGTGRSMRWSLYSSLGRLKYLLVPGQVRVSCSWATRLPQPWNGFRENKTPFQLSSPPLWGQAWFPMI